MDPLQEIINNTKVQAPPLATARDTVLATKLGLAVLTAFCVLLVSVALEPPFLLKKDRDPLRGDKFCYEWAYVLAGAAGAAVMIVPRLLEMA